MSSKGASLYVNIYRLLLGEGLSSNAGRTDLGVLFTWNISRFFQSRKMFETPTLNVEAVAADVAALRCIYRLLY